MFCLQKSIIHKNRFQKQIIQIIEIIIDLTQF